MWRSRTAQWATTCWSHPRAGPGRPRNLLPKRLGAKLGLISVLHTWGSAMTHHPHVHMIVPSGGFSLDGQRWIACRSKFFLPVRVLSRVFRRLFIEGLFSAHAEGRLTFLGEHAGLADGLCEEAGPLADPKRCSPILPAIPIASPFQTSA